MPKDFVPCDIYRLKNLIEEHKKIKQMTDEEEKELFFKLLHNNFCRYIIKKGENKNTLCLKRFKDVNELKYCHIHRLEMKPWVKCQSLLCNGKTKKEYCRKCKRSQNQEIPNIPLPDVSDDESFLLLDIFNGKLFIENIYPNSIYRIKNYYIHNYYKVHTIYSDLIMPSYDEKGNKIKKIKNNEYCKYYKKYINKKKFIKDLKQDIYNYGIYTEFNMDVLYISVKMLINIKKWRKKYISLENACNVPLPPITNDEEILLNMNINDLYEKKINNKKDSNVEVLELNISENKNIENKETDKEYKSLCDIFKNTCIKCHSYKRFILDLCKINISIYDILMETFKDINNKNLIKKNEIFDIFKKPKIKPAQINKIHNELPMILSYGDKLNDLINIDLFKICKTFYIIGDDIDKCIEEDILSKNHSKYIYYKY